MSDLAFDFEHFFQDQLPHNWRCASKVAASLASRLDFLPWADRISIFDKFIWDEANAQLTDGQVTAVINRRAHQMSEPEQMLEFRAYCCSIATGALHGLGIDDEIICIDHALMRVVTTETEILVPAVHFMREHVVESLESRLAELPGFAFLFLTIFSEDTAESFLARDAFWKAIRGH